MPYEKVSAAGPKAAPRSISGAVHCGEPIAVGSPITLDADSPIAEALRGEYTIGGQPSAPVVTMLATSTGAQEPVVADFLEMTISSTEKDVAPTAADDFVETGLDTPVDIPVAALLANDTDLNGDTLAVTGVMP